MCPSERRTVLVSVQIPIGSEFKEPGYFATSSAPGKSNPITSNATVTGKDMPRLQICINLGNMLRAPLLLFISFCFP